MPGPGYGKTSIGKGAEILLTNEIGYHASTTTMSAPKMFGCGGRVAAEDETAAPADGRTGADRCEL